MSAWIDETPWMPRIHTQSQDIEHGGWLIEVCEVMVARDSTDVLGFLAHQGADIQALYVSPVVRGRGVGGALLASAKAQQDQLALWSFQANTGALRFYGRHGFVEDQRTDGAGNDEKLPDVHLIWRAANG